MIHSQRNLRRPPAFHPAWLFLLLLLLPAACAGPSRPPVRREAPVVRPDYSDLARQVEIIRTDYGVPHIRAGNLKALAFGLAWCQMEDYGARVAEGLVRARGTAAKVFADPGLIESDFRRRRAYDRAVETYHLLGRDTRDVLEGFAAGVTAYMGAHPEEFEGWPAIVFTGHDVSALTIGGPSRSLIRRFVGEMNRSAGSVPPAVRPPAPLPVRATTGAYQAEEASNAWAFAPSRTRSGNAILVRNPHLAWSAGYYEAHLIVPGVLDFYGDIRVGGAFAIIGGFNRNLGWSTTNNYPDLDEIYELTRDPDRPGRFLFDGASLPIRRVPVEIEYVDEEGAAGTEVREYLETPLGPVIYTAEANIYVIRSSNDGEYRRGEQYLRMMQARNLEEWKAAMRMQAIGSSNYTYADADGNILFVWNARLPDLPHEARDIEAVPAKRSSEIWTRLIPFDALPQLLNPEGGYVQNSNNPPYYTNLNAWLDPADFDMHLPEPALSLRSQLSLMLVDGDRRLTLEDVVALKHDMRMLLADRVKEELVAAVRDADPEPEVEEAIRFLDKWDNTVAAGSRGGVLFEAWWKRYTAAVDRRVRTIENRDEPPGGADYFRYPWSSADPMGTPRGLAHPDLAAEAFVEAVETTRSQWGDWDVAWGEVHRVRRGNVDLPVGGGDGRLGSFRVLGYRVAEDGRLVADRGDGWVLVVEFSDPPRAYSILAYGQSAREDSPHFSDQAGMFARNEMKRVAFTEEEIRAHTIRRYRPQLSTPVHKYAGIRVPLHPALRRCSSSP